MRINIISCCLLFLITAACKQSDRKIQFQGNIVPVLNREYTLYLQDNNQQIPIQPDSIQGNFSLEYPGDSSHLAILTGIFGKEDNKWFFNQPLFLTPDEKVEVQLRPGVRHMEIIFHSKDHNNNALKEYQNYYLKHSKSLWDQTPEPSQAKEFLMGFCNKAEEIIQKYQPSSQVTQYLNIFGYLQYLTGINHLNFIYHKDPNKKVPEDLAQAVPTPENMLDNSIALLFSNDIQNIILDDLEQKASQPETQLELLHRNFKHPQITALITRSILQSYLLSYDYTQNFEEGLMRLKKMCTLLPQGGEQLVNEFRAKRYSVEGADLPDATIEDIDGKQYKLSDFKGKYLYIDLWASWCVPCCKEVPYLQKLEKQVRNPQLEFISISIDKDKKDWKSRMKQLQMEGHQFIAVGDELTSMLNVQGIPHFLIYNKDGKLLEYKASRPSTGDRLKDKLNQLK